MLKPYRDILIEEILRSTDISKKYGSYTNSELEKCSVAQLESILEKIRKGM